MTARVGWLFSLIRSGSSAAVYAAAAPWKAVVADEPLGPWDRTGGRYGFPPEQRELVDLFKASARRLTPDVVELTNIVLQKFAEQQGADLVIVKCPHIWCEPEQFRAVFPDHHAVYLIRNPMHRLNSIRRSHLWLRTAQDGHDAATFARFLAHWVRVEHKVVYDDLRRDPVKFFGGVWDAFGLEYTGQHVAEAVDYQRRNYHASSKKTNRFLKPSKPVSERKIDLPLEAVSAYLDDPFIGPVMAQVGWPTDPAAYSSEAAAPAGALLAGAQPVS